MSSTARSRALDVNLKSGPQMLEYVAIADRIAGERPGRVLDWGCGHGQVSHLLLERAVDTLAYDYRPDSADALVQLEQYPDVVAHIGGDPVLLPLSLIHI